MDAVSLQILVDTDKGYIALNQEIADSTGHDIDPYIEYNLDTLNNCQWLGITTIGDVKLMLIQRKDEAVGLAKRILEDSEGREL